MNARTERPAPKLNARRMEQRLSHLRRFVDEDVDGVASTEKRSLICCNARTTYSFSRYSPSYLAFEARKAGLGAVGVMDDLSIAAAEELYEACKLVGIGATSGFRLRVSIDAPALQEWVPAAADGARIGPMELYGVPLSEKEHVQQFLKPIRDARKARQRKQVGKLNRLLSPAGIGSVDFDTEVVSITNANSGGTVSDGHVMLAVARRVLKKQRSESEIGAFLNRGMKLDVDETTVGEIARASGEEREFRLAHLLVSRLTARIQLAPNRSECVSAADAVSFAMEVGAVPAYCVSVLPEDAESLKSFAETLSQAGFSAISYAPGDLSAGQKEQLHAACEAQELLELAQMPLAEGDAPFATLPQADTFDTLYMNTAWAIVAHQQLGACNPRLGLLAAGNPFYERPLPERAERYAELGRKIDATNPEAACEQLKEELS